mmetsp:Transcript_88607/g.223144  ORF Transcript_88607/g.223144 Transcript_88607/m.223144 type:complete len:216 (-) Transcript_88607:354-1001(-)
MKLASRGHLRRSGHRLKRRRTRLQRARAAVRWEQGLSSRNLKTPRLLRYGSRWRSWRQSLVGRPASSTSSPVTSSRSSCALSASSRWRCRRPSSLAWRKGFPRRTPRGWPSTRGSWQSRKAGRRRSGCCWRGGGDGGRSWSWRMSSAGRRSKPRRPSGSGGTAPGRSGDAPRRGARSPRGAGSAPPRSSRPPRWSGAYGRSRTSSRREESKRSRH